MIWYLADPVENGDSLLVELEAEFHEDPGLSLRHRRDLRESQDEPRILKTRLINILLVISSHSPGIAIERGPRGLSVAEVRNHDAIPQT